jgi:phosphoserine phosphatase
MNKIKNKYKLIIFDIDGTLTNIPNSWKFIHKLLNTWENQVEKLALIFEQNMISYKEFCEKEVELWSKKNVHLDTILNAFKKDLKPAKNLYETLKFLKNNKFKIIAISSGLQFVPKILELEKYFDEIFCNQLEIKDGFLTKNLKINVENNKIEIFEKFIKDNGFKYDEIIFVGDGKNDLHIAKKAGHFIAVDPKIQELKNIAKFEIKKNEQNEIDMEILKEYIYKNITN